MKPKYTVHWYGTRTERWYEGDDFWWCWTAWRYAQGLLARGYEVRIWNNRERYYEWASDVAL